MEYLYTPEGERTSRGRDIMNMLDDVMCDIFDNNPDVSLRDLFNEIVQSANEQMLSRLVGLDNN